MTENPAAPRTVDLAEIAEIELFVLKRMKEYTLGDRASVFRGPGFNFVGIRDWQPGDRPSSIDWAQSSLNGFGTLITREFEQDSTGTIIAVADASLSTGCGMRGIPISTAIARALAAVGLSAVLFQDLFGLVTFDDRLCQVAAAPPRIGKTHVVHCLELYERRTPIADTATAHGVIAAIKGQLQRRTALVPVISDFLFADAERLIRELSHLNAVHDVYLMMVDARFAYQLPAAGASWVETLDVETGQTLVLSRRELGRLAARVDEWQQKIFTIARDADLDIVRVGLDRWEMETALIEFAAERRLRNR